MLFSRHSPNRRIREDRTNESDNTMGGGRNLISGSDHRPLSFGGYLPVETESLRCGVRYHLMRGVHALGCNRGDLIAECVNGTIGVAQIVVLMH